LRIAELKGERGLWGNRASPGGVRTRFQRLGEKRFQRYLFNAPMRLESQTEIQSQTRLHPFSSRGRLLYQHDAKHAETNAEAKSQYE